MKQTIRVGAVNYCKSPLPWPERHPTQEGFTPAELCKEIFQDINKFEPVDLSMSLFKNVNNDFQQSQKVSELA